MKTITRFTLIELLVVIAIISILMTILLPALQMAKGQVYKIQCLGSLKQIGMGNAMYADVYSGWVIPATYTGGGSWNSGATLHLGLKTVLGINPNDVPGWPKAYICPKATLVAQVSSAPLLFDISQSYGMNITSFPSGDYMGCKMSQIKDPSSKLNFADGTDKQLTRWGSIYATYYGLKGEYYGPSYYGMTAYRHMTGAGLIYYDGHASNINYQILQGNSSIWNLW